MNELVRELKSDIKAVGRYYRNTYGVAAKRYYFLHIFILAPLASITLYLLLYFFIAFAKTF